MKKDNRLKIGTVSRILAVFMVLVLILLNMPISVFATGTEDISAADSEVVGDLVEEDEEVPTEHTESSEREQTGNRTEGNIAAGQAEISDAEEASVFTYDSLPVSLEEVQAAIDAWEAGEAKKPRWEFQVDKSMMPEGWRCDSQIDVKTGRLYWTFFPENKALGARSISVTDQTGLQSAIDAAVTVYAGGDDSVQTIIIANDIALTNILTISGGCNIKFVGALNPVTVLAGSNYRHIKAETSTAGSIDADISLAFENVVLDGGHVSGNTASKGGIEARLQNNHTMILTNAEIKNCYKKVNDSDDCGGGIYIGGGNLTMKGGTVSSNIVWSDTDYTPQGGGIYVKAGNLTIDGSTISGNRAMLSDYSYGSGSGGGAYVENGNFVITNGAITGNAVDITATGSYSEGYGYGGGLYIDSGNFQAANSEISGNEITVTADSDGYGGGYGGGVYLRNGGDVKIENSEIVTNTIDGIGGISGGGMYLESVVTFLMQNSEISSNTLKGKGSLEGGGLCITYASESAVMENSKINNNTAQIDGTDAYSNIAGGGAYISFYGESFIMENSEISGNTAQSSGSSDVFGGGLWIYGSFTMKGDSKINENTAQNSGDDPDTFGYGAVKGGGVYIDGDFVLEGGEINNNKAAANGNGGAADGGGVYGQITADSYVDGASIINNTVFGSKFGANGGGLYIISFAIIPAMRSAYFPDSSADFILKSGRVSNNIAKTESTYIDEYTSVDACGGGIYLAGVKMIMDGGTIDINKAEAAFVDAYGGGISMGNGMAGDYNGTASGSLTMNDGDITGNTAESNGGKSYGGGIYGSGGYMEVYTDDSGAEDSRSILIEMKGGRINENTADYGGGLYSDKSYFGIDGGRIVDNAANIDGGGIYGLECSYNSEKIDGGTSVNSTVYDYSIKMSSGEISANTAENNGGGIYLAASYFDMAGGAISNNTADNDGGGIYAIDGYDNESTVDEGYGYVTSTSLKRSVEMSGGELSGNNADSNGGGVYLKVNEGDSSEFNMSAGKIDGNTAGNNGGGVYAEEKATFEVKDSLLRDINNVSITNNTASNEGGGIYTEAVVDYDNLTPSDYQNIATASATVFSGNTASASYEPPSIASSYTNIGFSGTSITSHPINNDDINYRSDSPLVFTYTVTYNPNGGSGTAHSVTENVGTSHTVLSNTDSNLGFDQNGYTFLGWSTNAVASVPDYTGTGSETIGSSAVSGDTVTLYAVWQENTTPGSGTYTVTYEPNGGSGNAYSVTENVGAPHTVLSNTDSNLGFDRTDGTFLGWSTNAAAAAPDYTGTGSETVGSSAADGEKITLYAVWKTETDKDGQFFTVTYNPNRGIGNKHSLSVSSGSIHTVKSNSDSVLGYTYKGYRFAGWNTAADGSGTSYAAGAEITIKEDITLYARWVSETDKDKDKETNSNTDSKESKPKGSVKTGDTSWPLAICIFMFGLSISIMLYTVKRKTR